MLQDLLDAIKLREDRVELAGHTLLVREIANAADLGGETGDPDLFYRLIVACTFDEQGAPALGAADIPALKAGSRMKLAPLVAAVRRVNGLDAEADAKK